MNAGVVQQVELTGMTCAGCVAKVKHLLSSLPGVHRVDVDLEHGNATINSVRRLATEELSASLRGTKYALAVASAPPSVGEERTSDWRTYQPLVLVFAFITGVSILTSIAHDGIDPGLAMRHFMAGFFLVFSFFKLLDLRGFADAYAGYDLLARQVRAYGYAYPFIELGLGVAYLVPGIDRFIVNATTIVVMGFSAIGVLRAVLNKQRIQCACLGTVFKLPMSMVTIVEDLLMVAMAVGMLVLH